MKVVFFFTLLLLTLSHTAFVGIAGNEPLAIGNRAPNFSYHQLNGKFVGQRELRGHPYIVWLVASWCSSCKTGSLVVADHIAMLKQRGIRIVELQLANDLGAPGPGLPTFQSAVGKRAQTPGWYWGVATEQQTLVLDPKGYADVYYLVNRHGMVVGINGNPSASWNVIQHFAKTTH